jgi:hypothetical protein
MYFSYLPYLILTLCEVPFIYFGPVTNFETSKLEKGNINVYGLYIVTDTRMNILRLGS